MKRTPYFLLAITGLVAVIMFNACDDSEGPGPTVTITSPSAEVSYRSSDQITIRWRATHNVNMTEAQVRLRNTTDNADAYTDSPSVQGLQDYTYTASESISVPSAKSFTLFVTVTDVDGQTTEKSVNFTIEP